MKATVLLNAKAGALVADGASTRELVEQALNAEGVDARVLAVEHDALQDAIKEAAASNADVVVLGGGDGTLSTGAAVLIGTSKPMGVLPLGTLNHFAKDLGIPLDLGGAAKVIALGHSVAIDVGEVNGHVFLNNSSIGLYPSAVDERDELRHREGGGKLVAMFHAAVDVMRRFPLLDVIVTSGDSTAALRVPFVFVGNNRYDMSLFSLGKRQSLQEGELGLYFTQTAGRLGILRLAFLALVGRMRQDRDFHYMTLKAVEIRTRKRSLRVSMDGEVVHMTSPIRYSIKPGALRVLTPKVESTPVKS
ncbi:MAG: diacylglycerol kinase family protein [Vicinamibacteria bacterium]